MSHRDLIDFNKQILFGEVGSLLGAQLCVVISYLFTNTPGEISWFAVAGSLIGAVVFWLVVRIRDERRKKRFSLKKLGGDVAVYTPAAVVLVVVVYQPALYFLTRFFLDYGVQRVVSSSIAQLLSFLLFLILINGYRLLLIRFFKKSL